MGVGKASTCRSSSVIFCQDHGPISPDNLCAVCYLLVAPRARNSSPGNQLTRPASCHRRPHSQLPSRWAARASSDPDLATAANTLFWPSDRRRCRARHVQRAPATPSPPECSCGLRAGVFFAASRSSCAVAVRGLEG